MSMPSSSVAKTFLALPSYSSFSATLYPPFQFLNPLEDRPDVAQGVRRVEEVPEICPEPLAHLFFLLEQLSEAALPLPGLHRRALDDRVGVVAAHARLHEGEQDAPGVHYAAALVEVVKHPVLVDLEPAQNARRGPEHVENEDRGVR